MPFSKDLAPQMLHTHRSHAEAVARITWCIDERVMGVVTGEVGAGKTVAVRAHWPGSTPAATASSTSATRPSGPGACIDHRVGARGDPAFSPGVAHPSGHRSAGHRGTRTGRRVVLIFDEAHLLDADQLEGLRLLSGAEMDADSPFACLLVGQPTLRRRIRLGVFAALDQRVALRYAMAGMEPAETADYVGHHLKIAGRTDTLFSDDALALIHQASRGLPRAVNNLAVQSSSPHSPNRRPSSTSPLPGRHH